MHDIKAIRADPEAFDAGLKRRGVAFDGSKLADLDLQVRRAQAKHDDLASQWQQVAGAHAMARHINFKTGEKGPGFEAARFQGAQLGQAQAHAAEVIDALSEERKLILSSLPNIPGIDVPDGLNESANIVVHTFDIARNFGFALLEHDIVALRLGYDPDAAAAIAGARFAVLKGPLARLHRALGQFMIDVHTAESGYTEVAPPLLVREAAVFGVGQLPKFEDDLFKTTDGRYLISTAEVPLTNLVREQILDVKDLPLRFTALTPCFRSEAGSAGRDTRGLIRQHQFDKVELVSIVAPEQAADEHERMTRCAETILERLELPYRRMLLCAGDMGFAARKTYDLEVWLPGQGQYREISSCSDCGDFQARRMDTRYRAKGEKGTRGFVHTLNGSGVAVGRALVAVLENYQQADGSVIVPNVLLPYMGGVSALTPD